ncbi:MAG: VWA domain-containing protein [Rhodocyclaceae bacterium]|nr:MAG: VWA domain-containing protein [Rhodocyclaceae bacterium]MBE7420980.1 VWA domain-containing protein [Zoogloeaceae bacterium]
MHHPQVQAWWREMDCGFTQVADVFEECLYEALASFSKPEMDGYVTAAKYLSRLGRGPEPVLAFLEAWPSVAAAVGTAALDDVMATARTLQASPNGHAIAPFLQTLAPVARRLASREQLAFYLDLAQDLMARTTGSIHGGHATHPTIPSPGLPAFFRQAPQLVEQLPMAGLQNWVDYGIRHYGDHPQQQEDYFKLALADSRAVLARERHGTLFADAERRLDLTLRALWRDPQPLIPYSNAWHALRRIVPYYDGLGMRLPDVYDARNGVSGLDRYRATLAHMAGHRRWSSPQIADNWSPFQRLAVEFLEDARIDRLLMREYPGLAPVLLALHPQPVEGACDPETVSCLRHRLAVLSRACLDAAHGYADPVLNDTVAAFHAALADGPSSTAEMAQLALAYVARTRRPSDQLPRIHFDDTVVDYRDDNRQLWAFIEEGDEEEAFDTRKETRETEAPQGLPPRHYPEWDQASESYRPDWVSLYEALHPAGEAAKIDRLLDKHAALARRLMRLLDLIKPQNKQRIRYREDGSELDLDTAIRSLIDFKCGITPDPRINLSHRSSGRSIAVLLLLDLSESLNQKVAGGEQTVLELSQEAVSLLGMAIERLNDPFAIAGFHSNTRHEVRYLHIKGFSERWDDAVKGRLAAAGAGWSTRMGAALRHAGAALAQRQADKRLLLLLTDGEPADIDVRDPGHLHADARKAVGELAAKGVDTFCLSLDPKADGYVREIFGRRHLVLDRVEQLPEKLPLLYMALTK